MDKCPLSIHERYHIQNSELQPERRPHHLSRDHSHGQRKYRMVHHCYSQTGTKTIPASSEPSSEPRLFVPTARPSPPALCPSPPLTLVAPVCSLHPASRASLIFAPQPVNKPPFCRPTPSCHTTTLLIRKCIRKCLAHSFTINASSSTKRHSKRYVVDNGGRMSNARWSVDTLNFITLNWL